MSFFQRVEAQLRYEVKHILGRHPTLYNLVFRFRDGYQNRLVDDDTDLCIEGFPRSANSFAVGAFQYSQEQTYSIAHHNHVPAPILDAAHRGLPTIVLIRDPVDAVVSGRGLQLQIGAVEGKEVPQYVSYETKLEKWISFYERIQPVRDRIVIAPFDRVIEDFGVIIEAVNNRFGTKFAHFQHSDENLERIRKDRGYHAVPSEQRDLLKARARNRFERELGTGHRLVKRARRLYRSLVATAYVS